MEFWREQLLSRHLERRMKAGVRDEVSRENSQHGEADEAEHDDGAEEEEDAGFQAGDGEGHGGRLKPET